MSRTEQTTAGRLDAMKPLRISMVQSDTVDITSDEISFCYINRMYKGGRAGVGLQVEPHLNGVAVENMCVEIAQVVLNYAKSLLNETNAEAGRIAVQGENDEN